ncbi:amidase domain-containing protein [Paenibacillus sp. UMB4589-SE434]|uniref:amidase domain-containing protein n=1 Tax=Paenibacillus sp. UMB4589-SE434 TaxID=3046314 RepID=UPI00254AEAC4|nr:amidase domain-containing protein [Paenibacillus sp. UMB4589-SE434]MDK8183410.1 amidase domain-containing protein [Paenibacillus sp. UMB4589-SE434]
MKKRLTLLAAVVVSSLIVPTSGATSAAESAIDMPLLQPIVFETKGYLNYYSPMMINGKKINLYPETTTSKEEAIRKYNNGYQFIVDDLTNRGVIVDLDNEQVQDLMKTYFLIELEDKQLQQEIRDFAIYMDFYENKVANDKIIQAFSKKSLSSDDVNVLLPSNFPSTAQTINTNPSGDENPDITPFFYESSYAATYATNWWNKTNNTSYPYYANYYNQTTATDNINDLPAGASGQSNPRRAWNDCTNFVSQALQQGGLSSIKNGILNPHSNSDNWYYSDSKPSFTWGGAHNFYQHFSKRAGVASSSSVLSIGDAVSIDFTGDGSIDHTIIITKTTGTNSNQQYVTYHTTDTNQTKTLDYFYNNYSNSKVYGYEIDKIQ